MRQSCMCTCVVHHLKVLPRQPLVGGYLARSKLRPRRQLFGGRPTKHHDKSISSLSIPIGELRHTLTSSPCFFFSHHSCRYRRIWLCYRCIFAPLQLSNAALQHSHELNSCQLLPPCSLSLSLPCSIRLSPKSPNPQRVASSSPSCRIMAPARSSPPPPLW